MDKIWTHEFDETRFFSFLFWPHVSLKARVCEILYFNHQLCMCTSRLELESQDPMSTYSSSYQSSVCWGCFVAALRVWEVWMLLNLWRYEKYPTLIISNWTFGPQGFEGSKLSCGKTRRGQTGLDPNGTYFRRIAHSMSTQTKQFSKAHKCIST